MSQDEFTSDKGRPRIENFSQVIALVEINFFPALTKGKVAIRAVIDNQDVTNNLTFVKNGRGGSIFVVPPNSLAVIDNEILEALVITPNATTGVGLLTADLSFRKDLIANGFLK